MPICKYGVTFNEVYSPINSELKSISLQVVFQIKSTVFCYQLILYIILCSNLLFCNYIYYLKNDFEIKDFYETITYFIILSHFIVNFIMNAL